MKKVLIITYYWPPAGGAGVQRWLKFAKYLRDFGWEPVIYTPENSEIPETDLSLLKDIPENITVLKTPIWEPYNIYKLITFSRKKKINVGFLSESRKPKLSQKFSVWIRSNFFIPDARYFWIKPSVRYLADYLNNNPVDAIITTGPPHSLHLIALRLLKKIKSTTKRSGLISTSENNLSSPINFQISKFPNLKWLADFRDPWTNIDFYKDLKLSSFADRKHHKLEYEVLKHADAVITVGNTMAEEFNSICQRHYDVITNGYDADDIINLSHFSNVKDFQDNKFSIAHIGTMPKSRNPVALWKLLKELIDADDAFASDLEIKLVGKLDITIIDDIENNGLDSFVKRLDYLPHDEVLKVQAQSQLLLLVINNTENAKGILTGKFFEYLAAGRPVLCIGPVDGDVAEIINETNSGTTVAYSDNALLRTTILKYYNAYKSGTLCSNAVNIEKYSRKELTRSLAQILNRLSE